MSAASVFTRSFLKAVKLINSGEVDVKPLISATLPLADAVEAFDLANDRSRAMKVQLSFQELNRMPARRCQAGSGAVYKLDAGPA